MLSRFEDLTGTRSGPFEVVPATKPIDLSTHWAPNFAIIAFMIVMSLVVFTWMYSAYFQKGDSIATGTVGVATVTPMADSLLAAVGTQPTIATQGGGVATVTLTITPSPLPSPTATVAPQPTATTPPVEVPAAPTEAEPADDLTDEPATAGAHAFVVWVLEEVWVHVTIDGEPVYNDVLPAGGELVYEGETLEVTSGNAAHVVVYVDGEEYALGNSWDATFVYP